MTELNSAEGQAASDSTGATGEASVGTGEQSVANVQTTIEGTGTTAEESFFDPKDVLGTPLEAGYKQMQSAFTKKMQSFTGNQHKVDAYNQFEANPMGALQQLAQQYGYQLTQPGQQQTNGEAEDFQPQTWDEVMDRAKGEARKEMMKDFDPLISEIKQMKQSNMETYMDNNHPDWRTYESDMMGIIAKHPTLAKDPSMVYDLALPPEVKTARANKAALAKIQGQASSSEISGGTSTNKKPSSAPEGIKTLDDAVKFARAKLSGQGMNAPRDN